MPRTTFDLVASAGAPGEEQDRLLAWLSLDADARLLDVGCGTGGPALRAARKTGASVVGLDPDAGAVEAARAAAAAEGLAERVLFVREEPGGVLPFPDASFGALVSVDAVHRMGDRAAVLSEWARVLAPGGRLAFTDPLVVTGPVAGEEVASRCSGDHCLLVPAGWNEGLLEAEGFRLHVVEDRTSAPAGRQGAAGGLSRLLYLARRRA